MPTRFLTQSTSEETFQFWPFYLSPRGARWNFFAFTNQPSTILIERVNFALRSPLTGLFATGFSSTMIDLRLFGELLICE